MLNKKTRLSIFLIIFCPLFYVQAKSPWLNSKVIALLDNNAYLLENKEIIKPLNISIESRFSKRSNTYCQQNKINKILNKLILHKTLYFQKKYPNISTDQKIIHSSLRFKNSFKKNRRENLEIFLLKNGFAKNLNLKNKKYISAQKIAKNKGIGIWGECNPWNNLQRNLSLNGLSGDLNSHEKIFLKNNSTAWVSEILENNNIKLRNGMIIRLKNIKFISEKISKLRQQEKNIKIKNLLNQNYEKEKNNIFLKTESKRKTKKKKKKKIKLDLNLELEKCFSKKSHEFLIEKLVGKKVILKTPQNQRVKNKVMSKYLFLVKTPKIKREVFFNDYLIASGYGKFYAEVDDKYNNKEKYLETMKNSQKKLLKHPKGIFKECLEEQIFLLKNLNKKSSENPANKLIKKKEKMPEIIYDPKCKIKGNISGSKKNPVKKYHTPKSGWYKKLKYEACFNSELQAEKLGFIKVK